MIPCMFLESVTIPRKNQSNSNYFSNNILPSNINEIYVDNPDTLLFQIWKIKLHIGIYNIFGNIMF